MKILKNNDTILFQGDSITDAGRNDSPDGLGYGYVSIIRGLIGTLHRRLNLRIINRGVGGDRTEELLKRWKKDCEKIKPDVLSIKIGVNDVWRIEGKWNGQTFIGPEDYRKNYIQLIERALKAGIRQLILCSPTTIENNKSLKLSALLQERKEIVKSLAKEYKALYVPFQEDQLSLLLEQPGIMWTEDGCHPTMAGHAALARCWINAVGLI